MNTPLQHANRTVRSHGNLNRAAKRKQLLRRATFEQLELRTLLSTVDITGGAFTYDAANAASSLTVSSDGTTETVADSSQTITLTANAMAAGWSGSGTNTVSGPNSSITSMEFGGTNAGQSLTLDFSSGDPVPASGVIFDPTVAASGINVLVVDAIANTSSATLTMDGSSGNASAPFEITGLSGAIEFASSITTVTLDGGTNGGSGVTYNINSTANSITTNVTGQEGGDIINVNGTGTSGTLNVTTGSNNGSTVNVVANSEAVNVTGGALATVNIGSTGGTGTLANIQGAISVTNPPSLTSLNIHDENDTTGQTWTLNNDDGVPSGSISVTGSSTISYDPFDLSSLTINGGSGGNTFNVNNTSANYTTTLNTGSGDDAVNVFAAGSGGLDVDGQAGIDTVTLGGAASSVGMQDLNGTIDVTNDDGFTNLTLDDSEDTTGQTATLGDNGTTGTITGLSPATITYTDNDISSLTVNGGSGGNDFTVTGTLANGNSLDTLTTLNKGSGSNTVNVEAITNDSTLDLTGSGSPDTVNLGLDGDLSGIQGNLNINEAPGSTNLVIDLSTDSNPHDFDLFSSDGTTSTLVDEDGNLPNPITFNTASVATLTIDGNPTEDESLNLDFSGGFDPIPSGSPGLIFNAGNPTGGATHALTITGELNSGPFASEIHTANDPAVTPAVGQYGSISFDDGTGSPTALTSLNYTGLNPFTDTTPVVNYTFNDFADDQSFSATDGPVVGGFQTIEFANTPVSPPPTFETTDIANKNFVIFNTPGPTTGINAVVNVPVASDGLLSLAFNTPTGGDNNVAFINTPAGIVTSFTGGSDEDITPVTGLGVASGTVLFLNGGTSTNTLDYDAGGETPTITAGLLPGEVLITIPGAGIVDAVNYQQVNITDITPPVIMPGAAATVHAVEGAPATLTVGTFTLPLVTNGITNPAGLPASDFTATIHWGDGSTSAATIVQDATNPSLYYINGTHTYTTTGGFTITDSIAFAGGTYTSTLNGTPVSVTLAAAGPTAGTSTSITDLPVTGSTKNFTAVEGQNTGLFVLATFEDPNTLATVANVQATLAVGGWGDGTPVVAGTALTVQQIGLDASTGDPIFEVLGSHTYAEETSAGLPDTLSVIVTTSGGVTTTLTSPPGGGVTVLDAPLTGTSGKTITGIEGNSTGTVLLGTFVDANQAATVAEYTAGGGSVVVNWGDGSAPQTLTGADLSALGTSEGIEWTIKAAHTYADEGTYSYTITVTDDGGAVTTVSGSAVIADAALTAGTPVALTPFSGITISPAVGSFTDADPISPISDFTAIIYWGDGSNSAGTIDQFGGVGTPFTVVGTHAYATPGTYTITTNVTDVGGSAITLTGSAIVSDIPVTGAVRNFPAVEGQNTGTIELGTITDTNPLATAESLTATLGIGGWGDGTPAAATTLTVTQIGGTATTSLFEITGSHMYADEGAFTVNISVTTSGGVTTALTSGTATVVDAVLSPSLGTPIVATEGAASTSYVVGTFTDENPAATIADFTGVVTATSSSGATFTGTGVTFTALGGGAFSVSAGLTFPTAGVWSISTVVTDDGGNKALLITTANVAYAALIPGTTPNITSTVKLSTGLVVVGTFTDANPNPVASEFSSVIDWGDGSPTSLGTISITPGVSGGPSTINILGIHTYETYGQYTITVVTTEGGGQTVTTTSTANANQPHLVFINGPVTTVAGNKLPVIKIYAEDAFGNLAFQDRSSIKLFIYTGTAAEGKIVGIATAKIKHGIAQFSRIGLKIAGDYTLVAVDGRYAQAVSNLFSITPAAPKKIAFTSLPANADANTPFGVQVEVWDKYGNLEKSDSSVVTLALGTHPRQAALSGVTSATASGDIADFGDLVVSTPGTYDLVATDTELPHKQASATFVVG